MRSDAISAAQGAAGSSPRGGWTGGGFGTIRESGIVKLRWTVANGWKGMGRQMAKSLAHKFGKGLTPQGFIDAMTKNREAFLAWGEKFAWADKEDEEFFQELNYRDDLRCIILAADWCGDVVRNVPVVFKVMEKAGIPVEVLIMEQHLDTMDEFLTMGGRSIPVVIFVDTGGYVLGRWGPRPSYVQEPMVKFKTENKDPAAPDYQEKLAAARKEIMARYGEGTEYQQWIVKELRELISTF